MVRLLHSAHSSVGTRRSGNHIHRSYFNPRGSHAHHSPTPIPQRPAEGEAGDAIRPGGVDARRYHRAEQIGVENIEIGLLFNTTEEEPLASVAEADPTKWSARWQGNRYRGYSIVNADVDRLLVQMEPVQPEAGADVIGYDNNPSDVADSLGRQLAEFADFPL